MKYRIKIVLCTNAETALSSWGEDPTGNGWEDECKAVNKAEYTAINTTPTPDCVDDVDIDDDGHFPNWNGGKYSHQAGMYGWDVSTGLGAVRVYAVDDTEEGEEETRIEPAAYPQEIRDWFSAVEKKAGEAGAKIEAEAERRNAEPQEEFDP